MMILEDRSPKKSAGIAITSPASGPATATSKRAFLFAGDDRI
jgi:hypothetical protein